MDAGKEKERSGGRVEEWGEREGILPTQSLHLFISFHNRKIFNIEQGKVKW